ncbi:Flagellar P-ring protein FlgI [hydrothermal vent metagenome]|uniref:Flagellar P-ring protein FlgI n=1 Tax=hydrothermal vent metagenome TaxID=652676 RepID=A0A3B1A7C6_9ZZZZ
MLSIKELKFTVLVGILFYLGFSSGIVKADRIKDISTVAGVRSNPLVGYGLVVGLNGTGDGSGAVTDQSMKSMLSRLGINIPPDATLKAKNVAAVSIHATLPAFSKKGQKIDVTVASIGGAKSLRGGSLLMTPLRGIDHKIYAIAQGNVVVSGFGVEGLDGSKVTVNVPSSGRILNGAMVEQIIDTPFGTVNEIVLNLHQADFTTSTRLAEVINNAVGPGSAHSIDPASVSVNAPSDPAQRVSFISFLENLTIKPGEAPAKIIINSRTGTVVIGKHVHVLPAAVSHGSLTVTITQSSKVNQPAPLAGGVTTVVPVTDIRIQQEDNRMFVFSPGVSLNEIVQAVNQVGAAPGDLVAILEALKEVGALQAELVVI